MKMPKYQTINYTSIESGVYAFEPKEDKPNDTISIPKFLRLELPIKPCAAPLFLCNPMVRVNTKNHSGGEKLTGLFKTAKDGMFSGDIREPNRKKSTLLLDFGTYNPFDAEHLKVYYFFYYYVVPKHINKLIYSTFMNQQQKSNQRYH